MMFVLTASSAVAGPAWVLHDGDAPTAHERAVAASGRAPWEVVPVTLSARLAGQSHAVIGAPVAACADAAVDNAGVRKLVKRGDDLVVREEFEAALPELTQAERSLRCLTQTVEPTLGKDLFLALGATLSANGDAAGARRAFGRALSFDPGFEWARFPDAFGRALFEEVRSGRGPAATLALGPGFGSTPTLFVDGALDQRAERTLTAGEHLVQWPVESGRTRTVEITVPASGTVTLLVPSAIPDAVVRESQPESRAVLTLGAELGFGADDVVFTWTGADLLRRGAGGTWDGVVVPTGGPAPVASSPMSTPPRLGPGLRVGGLVTVGAGAVAGAAGLVWYSSAGGNERLNVPCPDGVCDGPDLEAYGSASAGLWTAVTGGIVAGVGAALVGASFAF